MGNSFQEISAINLFVPSPLEKNKKQKPLCGALTEVMPMPVWVVVRIVMVAGIIIEIIERNDWRRVVNGWGRRYIHSRISFVRSWIVIGTGSTAGKDER